jgi:cephalosporin hydroxylase
MIKFEMKKHRHIYDQPQFGENWFTFPNLYKEMVQKYSDNAIFVEVGAWKGKSAVYMAVEIANSNKNIIFHVVDTWEGSIEHKEKPELSQLYDIFIDNMKPFEKYYIPQKMTSLEAAEKFDNNSIDFIFIDASHEYQDVINDLKAWYPKLKIGGTLAGHDYYPDQPTWGGVYKAVNEVFPGNHQHIDGNCFMIIK